MKIFRHVMIIIGVVLLLVGVPLYCCDFFPGSSGGVDAVSTASVVIEQPSGAYVVWINEDKHTDKDNLKIWKQFFSGEEIDFLFEDISCTVPDGDTTARELAASFASRLPENQMTVKTEDRTLMLSKAVEGRFDIIIMSKEVYEAYNIHKLFDDSFMISIESEGK